jgi:hypothetical protein
VLYPNRPLQDVQTIAEAEIIWQKAGSNPPGEKSFVMDLTSTDAMIVGKSRLSSVVSWRFKNGNERF